MIGSKKKSGHWQIIVTMVTGKTITHDLLGSEILKWKNIKKQEKSLIYFCCLETFFP